MRCTNVQPDVSKFGGYLRPLHFLPTPLLFEEPWWSTFVIHKPLLSQELACVVRPACESCECEGCSALRGLEAAVQSYEGTDMDKRIEVPPTVMGSKACGIARHYSSAYTDLDAQSVHALTFLVVFALLSLLPDGISV